MYFFEKKVRKMYVTLLIRVCKRLRYYLAKHLLVRTGLHSHILRLFNITFQGKESSLKNCIRSINNIHI